jgi:hypothetical protein
VLWTEADFDELSWHDCHVWGIELRAGNPAEGDWTSDLALDIDYIVEWMCGTNGGAQFRVAPATLVFHGVTDPSIHVTWQPSGFQVALQPLSIAGIERSPVEHQKVYLDRAYHRFRIILSSPAGGEISLGAVGFTQTLRGEPVVTSEQALSLATRRPRG